MIPYRICVIDDELSVREAISMALEAEYTIATYETAESAIEGIRDNAPDLVLLDIGLPGMDGIQALKELKRLHPDMLVIMITAYEDINTVIAAMKFGAYDYVVKPLHMDSLEVTISNALGTISLRKEVQVLQEKYLKENLPGFIAESDAIQEVMVFVEMVAKSPDTPVLIIGETGTGKELLARAIHFRSPNFKGAFMAVNCAAIPKDLIESELFGYERGAFSGASTSGKKGLIELAANGTLFLDEVGDLSRDAQAKLLRFLENGEFYRVGSTKKRHVETRVVSATNRDLENMIDKEDFRKDLYFRLGVIKVQVPSLNQRREDIIPMAKHFLSEFNHKFRKAFTGVSTEAEKALIAYNWKGHVRELKNIIERAVLVGKGSLLDAEALGLEVNGMAGLKTQKSGGPAFPPLPHTGINLTATLESLERHYMQEALRMAGGNESQAARLLEMNHHTFRYRKKRLEIE